MTTTQESNNVGLFIAEESSAKTLPVIPVWREYDPNTYSDFGGEVVKTARAPITADRQQRKGRITDLNASGGFNIDLLPEGSKRLFQGVMFADAREKGTTTPINGASAVITAVSASAKTFAGTFDTDYFLPGSLIFTSGFSESSNNGLKTIVSVTSSLITVSETLTDETPVSSAKIEIVGFKAAAGDINLTLVSSICALTSTVLDFTSLNIVPGEYVFIGGDETSSHFANNNPGYARVVSVSQNSLAFDDTTWSPEDETGTGLSIKMFFGTVIKNESTSSLIKKKHFQLERQVGYFENELDELKMQAEYITGAVVNECTVNFPLSEKATADFNFIAMGFESRDADDEIKTGTRVSLTDEECFNTSTDIIRSKLYINGGSLNPSDLFVGVETASFTITNNAETVKRLGTLGAFETSVGKFLVSGSVTAYFTDIAAVKAVHSNAEAGFNIILANSSNKKGIIFDIPKIMLSDGRLTVEADKKIKIPLTKTACKSDFGHTILISFFSYLPTVASAN
jgi:Phage tail tube protein